MSINFCNNCKVLNKFIYVKQWNNYRIIVNISTTKILLEI